jgi:starch-binding outer membrane protein, SusD/RagB family
MAIQKRIFAEKTALILYVLLFISVIPVFMGCKKFVETEPPLHELTSSVVFENDQSALSALAGIYARINVGPQNMLSGGVSLYAGLYADEIFNTTTNATYDPFYKNSLLATTNAAGSRFWGHIYPVIYHCNALLEGVSQSQNITDSLRQQLKGEAKLMRALCYYYLVQLYGDVPFVTSTDYRINSVMPRTPTAAILLQLESDLQEAAGQLPAQVINSNGRPNKWAARGLLSRVYMLQKKFTAAETECSAIINSGVFNLVSNLSNVFLVNSKETIWQLMPVGTAQVNSPEGNIFIPSSATARPTFALTSHLLNQFATNDLRRTNWLRTVTVNSISYTYPYKYKIRTNATISEANILLRLAEIYLMRAEARAEQSRLSGTDGALADLNIIRARAGLPGVSASTISEALFAIEQERRLELFSEWGHRYFDLKRWDKANSVLGILKSPNWEPSDLLWPIPQSELNLNVFLTQNPGY